MSDQFLPTGPLQSGGELQLQGWQDLRTPAPVAPKSPIERPLAAIRRYKWLMLVIVLLGVGGGVAATRFLTPQYEVQARLMITLDGPMDARTGPIRSSGVLTADDWAQLFQTFRIADAVVRKLSLYLRPNSEADAALFKGFTIGDAYAAGQYELTLNKSGKRWSLAVRPSGAVVDSGAAPDSVGRKLGFMWQIPDWAFAGSGESKVKFTVSTPRETARKLVDRLTRHGRSRATSSCSRCRTRTADSPQRS